MTCGQSIRTVYSKFAVFNGRAIRSEFWWFMLFSFALGLVFDFVLPMLGDIWSLINLLPTLSVTARRLHDTDRSGWWQILPLVSLVVLIPGIFSESQFMLIAGGVALVGTVILLIVWTAQRGTQGANRFGEDPFGNADADVFS